MLSRRSFISRTAVLLGGLNIPGVLAQVDNWEQVPVGVNYMRHIADCLKLQKKLEDAKYAKAAEVCTRALKKKKTIWEYIPGHYTRKGLQNDTIGNPGLMKDIIPNEVGEGDIVVTNRGGQQAYQKRGVYVIGLHAPFASDYAMENVYTSGPSARMCWSSDILIQSYVPFTEGVVIIKEIPFTILPASQIISPVMFWMLNAAILGFQKRKGLAYMNQWVDITLKRISMLIDNLPTIQEAAKMMDEKLPGDKEHKVNSIYFWDKEQCFMDEGYYRGNGICGAYMGDLKQDYSEFDILFIGSLSPRSEEEIEGLKRAKRNGTGTIWVGPFGTDGKKNPDGTWKYADVAIDNRSWEPEGVLEVKGYRKKVCPIGHVINPMVIWYVIGEFTDIRRKKGATPLYWRETCHNGRQHNIIARQFTDTYGYNTENIKYNKDALPILLPPDDQGDTFKVYD